MLASVGKDLKEPLLIALAEREDGNRSGKMVVCYHTRAHTHTHTHTPVDL